MMTRTHAIAALALFTVFTIGAYCVSAQPHDMQPCRAACVAKLEAH